MDAPVQYIESEHRHANCEFALRELDGQTRLMFERLHPLVLLLPSKLMLICLTLPLEHRGGSVSLMPQQRLGLPDGASWLLRSIHPYISFSNGMPVAFDGSNLGAVTLNTDAVMDLDKGTPLVQVSLVHPAFNLEELSGIPSPTDHAQDPDQPPAH